MHISYNDIFDRNIGLLSAQEQKKLKISKLVIFGTGGLGGVIAEILVRSGVGNLILVDRDKFEISNLNRQIFAFTDTVGQNKVDVTEKFLKQINPEIRIEKYLSVHSGNIAEIMNRVNIALLALDDVVPIVIISRYARRLNIPLIEGWAIPFGNVRVFTQHTPPLEELYHLTVDDKKPDNLSDDEKKAMNLAMLDELKQIEGIQDYYPELAMQRIRQGKIPSFAPMVWFAAVMMSIEAIKLLLGWGNIALSPDFSFYDPFTHTIP